jgi:hypothetical protein
MRAATHSTHTHRYLGLGYTWFELLEHCSPGLHEYDTVFSKEVAGPFVMELGIISFNLNYVRFTSSTGGRLSSENVPLFLNFSSSCEGGHEGNPTDFSLIFLLQFLEYVKQKCASPSSEFSVLVYSCRDFENTRFLSGEKIDFLKKTPPGMIELDTSHFSSTIVEFPSTRYSFLHPQHFFPISTDICRKSIFRKSGCMSLFLYTSLFEQTKIAPGRNLEAL